MRIFYIGAMESTAGWGGEWFLNQAFREFGNETYCLDWRKNRHRMYSKFLAVPPADACFIQRGDCVPSRLIDAIEVPMFLWDTEWPSRCETLIESGRFEHYFFWTQQIIDDYVERGWVNRGKCSILLGAFGPSLHRPLPGTAKDIDVLFMGSMTPRRRAMLDAARTRFNVTIASAFGEKMVRLTNRAKVVLNIHSHDFSTVEARVFETLGMGAFLLTERLSPENPFTDDELAQFDTVDELVDKLAHYLAADQQRAMIAARGHDAAMAGHTYLHRARQILDVMASPTAGARSGETVRHTLGLRSRGIFEFAVLPGWLVIDGARRGLSAAKRLVTR